MGKACLWDYWQHRMVVWDGIKPYLKKDRYLVAQEVIKLEGWVVHRHWNTENQGHFSQHLVMAWYEICRPLCSDGTGWTGTPRRVQASAKTREQTVTLQGWTGPWHAQAGNITAVALLLHEMLVTSSPKRHIQVWCLCLRVTLKTWKRLRKERENYPRARNHSQWETNGTWSVLFIWFLRGDLIVVCENWCRGILWVQRLFKRADKDRKRSRDWKAKLLVVGLEIK